MNGMLTGKEHIEGTQGSSQSHRFNAKAQGHYNTFIYNTDCSHLGSFFVYLANLNSSSRFLKYSIRKHMLFGHITVSDICIWLFSFLIWKTQQWPQDWKRSVFIPMPKEGNAKESSNYRTIALISHASKVMLKILQAAMREP